MGTPHQWEFDTIMAPKTVLKNTSTSQGDHETWACLDEGPWLTYEDDLGARLFNWSCDTNTTSNFQKNCARIPLMIQSSQF